jgi:hypothetical protein
MTMTAGNRVSSTSRTATPVPPELRRIRRAAARARASARLELFGACAMLSADRDVAGRAYLDTLLRTLAQGLGRAPVIFCETCPQTSFDEQWLLALLDSHARDDRDSFAFLLCSRLPHTARRHVGFLIGGMARSLGDENADPRMTA